MARKKVVKPTAAEKKIIDRRLRRKYPQMFKPGWGKSKSLLGEYAKQTGSGGSLAGASGSDLAEIQKLLNKNKSSKYKRSGRK
jgi:hypothetical protein